MDLYAEYLLVLQISASFQPLLDHPVPSCPLTDDMWYRRQNDHAAAFRRTVLRALDLIHVLPADRTDLFQSIDHAVHRSHTDLLVSLRGLIEDLLAAGTVIFQNDIDQPKPLFRYTASIFFQFLNDLFFLLTLSPDIFQSIPVLFPAGVRKC